MLATQTGGRRAHSAKCTYCKTRHGDNSPWWNASKNGWSITFKEQGRSRNRLLTKGWEGHNEAIRLWKAMSAEQSTAAALTSFDDGEETTVEKLVHLRLEYLLNNAGKETFQNAKGWLNNFCYHPRFGFANTTIREMRTGGIARIKQWVAAHKWNDTTKANVYKSLKALFNYATGKSEDSLGFVETSPIAKLNTGRTRVKGRARVGIFSLPQEVAILNNANPRGSYPQIAIAFRVLMGTGVRPEEFCTVTAADVRHDADGSLYWWINHKNIKKTGTKRRVYLTPEMQAITSEQLKKCPTGLLFRNCWGKPWDKDTIYQSFRRITARPGCAALGLNEGEVGARTNGMKRKDFLYVVYTYRHTFAHRHLTGFYKRPDGTPLVLSYGEVAELMGNSAAEVEKTYGKLTKATTYLNKLINHN